MFKRISLWALGLFVAATLAAFVNPASADIVIDRIGYICMYQDYPWDPPQYREGRCQNGDTTDFYITLAGDYMESGNVMVKVSHPTRDYALAYLARPRFVRFTSTGQRQMKIRIQGIYYSTENPNNVATSLPVEIAVTSALELDFTDSWLFWIGWEGDLYTPSDGKGLLAN
ncbi:MAG: hypothetical protein WC030_03815 [Candidatus Paceibacterota bacterium]